MQITGIILAGGKSLRMGTDKALLKFGGTTLLENAIQLLKPVCSNLLISSNNLEHDKFGYNIIPDEIKNCGPLGGIYSCLKQSECDWNVVLSVDAAGVTTDFIRFMISEISEKDAIIPVHKKGKEPLIALYHKKGLPEMEKMFGAGNFKMHYLLEKMDTKFVDVGTWVEKYPELFHNLNHPDDLSSLNRK